MAARNNCSTAKCVSAMVKRDYVLASVVFLLLSQFLIASNLTALAVETLPSHLPLAKSQRGNHEMKLGGPERFALESSSQCTASSNSLKTFTIANSNNASFIISFEEALEALEKMHYRLWNLSFSYVASDVSPDFFVSCDGLTEGFLAYYGGNNSVYLAEYPSGFVKTEVVRLSTNSSFEACYLWVLRQMDGSEVWVDATNGDVLLQVPARAPGVINFDVAVRVVTSPKPKVQAWVVEKYAQIGNYSLQEYLSSDGSIRGRFYVRSIGGVLYESEVPVGPVQSPSNVPKPVLYIQVDNDQDEYYMWEITCGHRVYYVDARKGTIRLNISEIEAQRGIQASPQQSPTYTTRCAHFEYLYVLAVAAVGIAIAAVAIKFKHRRNYAETSRVSFSVK